MFLTPVSFPVFTVLKAIILLISSYMVLPDLKTAYYIKKQMTRAVRPQVQPFKLFPLSGLNDRVMVAQDKFLLQLDLIASAYFSFTSGSLATSSFNILKAFYWLVSFFATGSNLDASKSLFFSIFNSSVSITR